MLDQNMKMDIRQKNTDIDILVNLINRKVLNIDMGGFNFEPLEAIPISPSPQLREIAPGNTEKYTMFQVPKEIIFRLSDFHIKHFSEQARQDLHINLVIARGKIPWQAGKLFDQYEGKSGSPVNIKEEIRTSATPGGPINTISNITGNGYHDNFPRQITRTYGIGFENDNIQFIVKNQSDLHYHNVLLEIYGWSFNMQGRTYDQIYRELIKR